MRSAHLLLLASVLVLSASAARASEGVVPPSPYDVLMTFQLDAPPIDGTSLCLPASLAAAYPRVREAAASEKWRDAEAEVSSGESPEQRILAALVAGRAARTRAQRRAARDQLRMVEDERGSLGVNLCAILETARLEFRLGRIPEASRLLQRARRLLDRIDIDSTSREGTELRESRELALEFLTAELRLLERDPLKAHLLFYELAKSDKKRTAAAAQMRLADIRFDSGRFKEARAEYERLLLRDSDFKQDPTPWALRASESSIRVGDLDGAALWLQVYLDETRDRDGRDAAEIRLADVDALIGEPVSARNRLEGVLSRRSGSPLRSLAVARLIAWRLDRSPKRLAELEQLVGRADPSLAAYALAVLIEYYQRHGDVDLGFDASIRLAYRHPEPFLIAGFSQTLGALLKAASDQSSTLDSGGCALFAGRLANRAISLVAYAPEAAPFIALGSCLVDLGLPEVADEVLRAAAHTFGGEVAEAVALPLARAALASGSSVRVLMEAETRIRAGGSDQAEWRWLRARAAAQQSQWDEVRSDLGVLAQKAKLPSEAGELAYLYARSLRETGAAPSSDEFGRLRSLLERPTVDPGDLRALAARIGATSARQQSARSQSLELYSLASENLSDPILRAESEYWRARLAGDRSAMEALALREDAGAWQKLARVEVGLEVIIDEYGERSSP